MHAAPSNVHHMSTRQKAQTKPGPSTKQRSPSPSQSSSSESSSSSSTSSSPKGRNEEQEGKEIPKEQPNVPEPPSSEQSPAVETSMFYRLSKRLSKKTPASEALTPVAPTKEAQEAHEMPPPDIPVPRQSDAPSSNFPWEHESGSSSLVSAAEQNCKKFTLPHLRGEGVGHQ